MGRKKGTRINKPAKNRLDLVGKRFGRLLVVKDAGNRIDSRGYKISIWKCQCDCGNVKVIAGSNLTSGDAKSCGCYNIERTKKMNAIPFEEYRINRVIRVYKDTAAKKGLPFTLSREQFKRLIDANCYYCGKKPSNTHKPHGKKIVYQGIDRLDNTRGYTPDNVVPCCIVCNKMKKAMNYNEFIDHIERIHNLHSKELGEFSLRSEETIYFPEMTVFPAEECSLTM